MGSEQYKKDASFDLGSSFSVSLKVFVTVKARQLGKISKMYTLLFLRVVVLVVEGGRG